MGIRIHQLPPVISNQIAAGEVIERPASVVKELLENSYDAGADSISIEIGYGGLNQIKISDNGAGIISEDLPLAVAAHATSKITKLDDLYAIESMGFRGEALASIASVAKVTISSKPASQDHAMMLQMKGAEYLLTPCARNIGTTIDVSDLFFNAPVRKRFLKSEQLEFQAIETIVKRFALSAPHIALSLKHNNKQVLALPASVSEQAKSARMAKIFGSAFVKDALFLDVERAGMRLTGWISGPNIQRSQNDRQWIYINQRMVKDKLIHHALKQAYEGLLHPGRFPACLLYFTINTAEVDVNVHPTKHEVRFQQPRLVHDFFSSQITEALKTKSIERFFDTSVTHSLEQKSEICEPYSYPNYPNAPSATTQSKQAGSANKENFAPPSWVFLNNRYSIVFIQQQPYLADVIALQKDWLLDQLQQLELPLQSRPLLVPISYPIPSKLKNKEKELHVFLEPLGVSFELSNEDRMVIRSVPIRVPYLDIRHLIEAISELDIIKSEALLQVICESQIFDPQLLSGEERYELTQLLQTKINETKQQPYYKSLTVEDCRKFVYE